MSKLGDFDINELILQLHSEMRLAFEIAETSEKEHGLRIDTIKTRFGRENTNKTYTDTDSDSLEILNGQRYPNEEDWEVEVNYKHRPPIPELAQSQNWISSYGSQRIINKLGDVSIINIKGISTIWKNKFENIGVSTIKELANLSASNIQELCKKYNTLKPLEFKVKILLLVRDFKPLRYTEFINEPINSLLQHSQTELKSIFRNRLTGPEICDLRTMASLIYLVLDSRFTNKLKLEILGE